MKYKKLKDRIVIEDLSQFNVKQIFDCGQIFRYNICGNIAEVISVDKYAKLVSFDDKVEIFSDDLDYFEHFFDLKRDYDEIKTKLSGDKFLFPCINYGYGIRILNQDLFEMIVSFIISANNNIKRIKNSLNALSKKFGSKRACLNIGGGDIVATPLSEGGANKIEYYAFPTLTELKRASVADYIEAGLGYRAEYMYDTIQKLIQSQLDDFKNLSSEERLNFLLNLKGIGEKVAHCILLFAMHETSVFPVDTWINKVYNDLTNTSTTNRKEISRELTNRYKNLSGYAQQYFFYYYRENKVN